jgi:ankyrin repeat protein
MCLVLAPLLRRWFPQRWRRLAPFHLHNLAYIGDTALTARYLERGADPNGPNAVIDFGLGTPPLVWAADQGSVRVAELLLRAGADVNGSDNHGRTALMEAAEFGQTDLVAFLLDNAARINDRDTLQGHTALFTAAEGGHLSLVKLLVGRGADTAYRVRHRLTAADWARRLGGRARRECADYLDGLTQTP